MALLITLDCISRALLFWTLRSHGGGEWDGGAAGDGRAFQLVRLASSLWLVLFWTWWPDGGVIGECTAYHIGLDSSGPAIVLVVVTWRWRVGWRRSW